MPGRVVLLENPFDKEVMLFPMVWESMGVLYTIQRYLQERGVDVVKTNIREVVEKDRRFKDARALMLTTAVDIRQYERLFIELRDRGVVLPDHHLENPSIIHDMFYYYPVCEELGIKQPRTFFYRLLEDYFDMRPHEVEALEGVRVPAVREGSAAAAVLKEAVSRDGDGLGNLRRRASESGFPEEGKYFVRGTVTSFKYLRKEDTLKKSPAVQWLLRAALALKALNRESRLLEEVMAALDGMRGGESLAELAVAGSLAEVYEKIAAIGLHLIAQGLVNENGFAVREYINIRRFGSADTVLPLNAEYRAVCFRGDVLSVDLWTPPHLFKDDVPFSEYALSDSEVRYIVQSCKKFSRHTGAQFFTMDFAKSESGELYLIEINPGYFTSITHERSKVLFAYWAAKYLLGEVPDERDYREFLKLYGNREWFFALNETYLNYLKKVYHGHPKLDEIVNKNFKYIYRRYAELRHTRPVYNILPAGIF
ncbi:ATP-grasp domain-containing protein [Desulfofundulus sp.]|uniref:ATP-grasp domain-containing protein n=1 Tax=Desulfofundulus sp. TaxID=2282750 RepID=UPI003C790F46